MYVKGREETSYYRVLERIGEKDIHLVEVGNFNKNMSMWSKNKPSDNVKH